ncbi:MAG: hypothetical protein NT117_02620 [Gammaproteobacteria bacterium]|nr:hypothetical protein [Gammaproteobacteria bacterium]
MSATVQHSLGVSRAPVQRELATAPASRTGRLAGFSAAAASLPSHQWPVDLTALARCRGLLNRHGLADASLAGRLPHESLMDVPTSYDGFCRSHFSSVRRTHPEMNWDDARPAYAVALAAHAVLCEALDDQHEARLAANWEDIRGGSALDWSQARLLIADGCRALSRIDPLAMHR